MKTQSGIRINRAVSSGEAKASRRRGWPALVFLGLAVAGIFRNELAEILRNATLLCLSCMGLG